MVCRSPHVETAPHGARREASRAQAPMARSASRFGLLAGAAFLLAACQTAGLNQGSGIPAASQAVNIASLTEVISSNPQDPGAYNMRGTAYGQQGRYNDALQDFNQALALNPGFYQALANRALVHRELGNSAQALADYTAAINANPAYDAAYIGRGNIYREPVAIPKRSPITNGPSCSTPPMRALTTTAR
jgi:tetratricopeptide (TPR) repeat protein